MELSNSVRWILGVWNWNVKCGYAYLSVGRHLNYHANCTPVRETIIRTRLIY